MRVRLIYIILLFLQVHTVKAASAGSDTLRLSILFAGDIMGHDAQIFGAYDDASGRHNYDTCFSVISPFIQSADIAVGNLEVTLAGAPYKGYPAFSSPDALAESLKKAGFDILITANNHSLDRGKKGLERTIAVLDSLGFIHTGTFRNQEERDSLYPLILEKNGILLSLLNYTYGTNGIKVSPPNIVNYIDTLIIAQDLEKAASVNPDFTIVTMHWGTEYERTENKTQRQLAGFILDRGAQAIVGMHPHVVQPIRMEPATSGDSINKKPVVYSLGNFISNQRERYRNGGIMVRLDLEKTDSAMQVNYSWLPVYVHKPNRDELRSWFVLVPASASEDYLRALGMKENEISQARLFYEDCVKMLGKESLISWEIDDPLKKPEFETSGN